MPLERLWTFFRRDSTRLFEAGEELIGGRTLYVRRSKTNHVKTVVLVHGINVSERYFRPFATVAQRRYDVVMLDLPGYGDSETGGAALTFDQLAETLSDFLKTIQKPVVLLGQSMGAQVCARVAVSHPEYVERLVLVAPTINHKERTLSRQAMRLVQDMTREPFMSNLIVVSDFFRFGPVKSFQTQRYMMSDAIEKQLKNVTVPTLIVTGERDAVSPPAWGEWLAAQSLCARHHAINGAPHNLHLTHPKGLLTLCDSFFAG